jgi:hypothetical protein
VRIDGAEGDQHVRVLGGPLRDLGARQRRVTEAGPGVDGEDDCGHVSSAVVGRQVFHGRRALVVRAEVLRRRVEQLVVEREATAAVLLDVDVRVDGLQPGDVHLSHGRSLLWWSHASAPTPAR